MIVVAGIPSLGRLAAPSEPAVPVLVGCIAAAALYALGVRRRARAWPVRRSLAFYLGIATVAVALGSGIDAYADRLASIHMVQHFLLTLVAAPLIAAGAPVSLALGTVGGSTRAGLAAALRTRPVRALTHPLGAWGVFVVTLVGWHLSPLYDLALRHPVVHDLEHMAFLAAALVFWVCAIHADPLPHRLGPAARLLYLLAAMPAMSVVGIWLAVSHSVRYAAYAAPARALGVSALDDQHLAGQIMWAADAVFGAITLVIACRALLAEERRAAARDAYAHPTELGSPAR